MPQTFNPLDNEWASSTGSNVYSGGSTSQFDYPPIAMYDMLITADPSDPNPSVFDIGDTYDIEYKVLGFDVSLDDAVVIRSDLAPGGGGIVVFEGINNFGQIEHMIWTPDFDLEAWYWDNMSGPQPPSFWVVDTNPAYVHSFVCFTADTRIETPAGLRRVGALRAGDRVITQDGGAQPVRWVGRRLSAGVGEATPVLFAPGSIGNNRALRLSQQHRVLVRSPQAELLFGAAEVLVPAKAMVDGSCVRYAPCPSVDYVHLLLDRHALLRAEGALCESLLLGDMALDLIGPDAVPPAIAACCDATAVRPILTYREARFLVNAMAGGAHAKLPESVV